MIEDSILIKGNKDGLTAVIDMNKFKDFEEMLDALRKKLYAGKSFYKGCTLKVIIQLKYLNHKELTKLKDVLFDDFLIKDCIFEDKNEKTNKVFNGINEGKTKFIKKTLRSGQIVDYPGNIVIIGDVNSGSEVHASGNVIVLGTLRGSVYAGVDGNSKAIVAAFYLQPQILKIADIVTMAPEDDIKPQYPEVAKVKGNAIIVEPYLPNKFI